MPDSPGTFMPTVPLLFLPSAPLLTELICLLCPPMLPQMPTFATQRQLENHKSEPLLFEVQLLRVGGQR